MKTFSLSEFCRRYPFVIKYLVLAVFGYAISSAGPYIASQRGDPHYPYLYLEEEVADTGEYLAPGEYFFSDSGEMTSLGKHVVFVAKLTPADEKDGRYWCEAVKDFNDLDCTYYPYSSEELPEDDLGSYVEVDGMVTGYYSHPTRKGSGPIAVRCPIVEICSVRHGDLQELAAPVIAEDSPHLSVSDDYISITLDTITYRSALTVAQFSLTSDADCYLSIYDLTITCGEDKVGYSDASAAQLRRYFDNYGSDELPAFGFDGFTFSDDPYTAVCPFEPADPHKSLVFTFAYRFKTNDGTTSDKDKEWVERELVMTYTPEAG